MEPTEPVASQQPKQPPTQPKNIIQTYASNKKIVLIGGVVLLLMILIPILILIISQGKTNKDKEPVPTVTPQANQNKKNVKPTPTAAKHPSQTIVYGTWTSQSSVIRAVDLATAESSTVATFPLKIKKVSILSPDTLLYIDQTDKDDHGQRISIYNRKEKQIVTNIPAAAGFGIDDYILSPNKKFLVIWEVKFSSETQTLQGGQSRIYAVDLTQPSVSNLLYDETATATIPIHYPRAILNNGTVFADQFIPNDPNGGTGWARGMSIVDFDGTNKQDISVMANGTYGSQPSLSPDGKYLLFAGYDGLNGNGTALKNGYRQAILTPNTVEILDTKTLQRFKLPNLPNTNTYSSVQWDKQTGNVIISILSSDTKQMGVYIYDLSKLSDTQIPFPTASGTQYGYVSLLKDNKTLIGVQSTDAANLGNLGETYAYAYTQLATLDAIGKLAYLSMADPFVQYIGIFPSNYFKPVLGVQTTVFTVSQPPITFAVLQGNANPQQYSFSLKTTLASRRLLGKSNSVKATTVQSCQNLRYARCALLGPKNSPIHTLCQHTEIANDTTANSCY